MEDSKSKSVSEISSTDCEQCSEQKAEASGVTVESSMDKKLDISSDQFDPLLALYSSQMPLPYPNVKCFNNIAEYESFMKGGRGRAKPENVEKKLQKASKGVTDPERIERLKMLMVNNPVEGDESGVKKPSRKQRTRKNVLTRMPLHEGSPLGELNRCVQQRLRVKVHIRSFKGLRGVCSGFLVAFDKFWNLVMVDVDETYRDPLLGQAFYHEKALTVTRLFDKLCKQEAQVLRTLHKDSVKAAETESSKQEKMNPEPLCAARSSISRVQDFTQASEGLAQSLMIQSKIGAAIPHGFVASSEQRMKLPKPRVEYGRVCTRHVNQLFIRGENVLLVNVQQE